MTGPWLIAAAAAGVTAGPFLRGVILHYSTPSGEPPPRNCPACDGLILAAGRPWRLHLPPTGRCPVCRDRIGPPLLAVELLTAAVLAVIAVRTTSAWELAAFAWLAVVAVPLAFIDVAVHRLPDKLTATAYAGTLALLAVTAFTGHHPGQLGRATLAGAALASLYLIMFLASPASIGLGDGKMAASVGTALGWLGWRTLVTGTVASFLSAGLFAVLLLVLRRAKRTDHMAYGPFILFGALAAIAI
jgi:leader peptidase (prepilin peptidase) / N-methyltransferase